MKINSQHWITGVKRDVIAGGAEMNTRRVLVIHFTNGGTAKSSVEHMRKTGLAIHIIIDRDGTIYQCRPFNRTCGHAGVKSKWRDPNTGKTYSNAALNACSIGIELANAGDIDSLRLKYSTLPPVRAKGLDGSKVRNWEVFPDDQLDSCNIVAQTLVSRYNLDDVTGHYWVAPTHRDDPGPAFPITTLRNVCGFTGLPVIA